MVGDAWKLNEVANTFAEAAGLNGKQKWGLVLSSSARVTQMTYQTVIGVRYPELVSPSPTGCTFGRFVLADEDLRGLSFGMYPRLTCMLLWMLEQWWIGCNSNSNSFVMPNQA